MARIKGWLLNLSVDNSLLQLATRPEWLPVHGMVPPGLSSVARSIFVMTVRLTTSPHA
jgi:hypothetical protein